VSGAVPEAAHPPTEQRRPYRLVIAPGARRALSQSLPPTAAFAAWEFISGPLLERPKIVGVPLRPPFEGLWRARRGEYRVRYRIIEERHEVVVLHIDHRRDAYRP
jgi:mRNA-degrading endonuclease RelE of RelBE toxin-antitoxin system